MIIKISQNEQFLAWFSYSIHESPVSNFHSEHCCLREMRSYHLKLGSFEDKTNPTENLPKRVFSDPIFELIF